MNVYVKILTASVVVLIAGLTAWYFYQHSTVYVRGAPEDRNGLWMAALMGFQGTPRYVGSQGDNSFFLVGDFLCSRYRAPTAMLRLPKTFPLAEGESYVVTAEMVPSYP